MISLLLLALSVSGSVPRMTQTRGTAREPPPGEIGRVKRAAEGKIKLYKHGFGEPVLCVPLGYCPPITVTADTTASVTLDLQEYEPPRASILISLYIDNNIMILIHFLIYHMVMADMRAHTNARTRTHTVFRHTLTGFVAALILCPPVTERFIPNDRRRSLPTSSCNPFVSLTQSTELPKKCICHGWCCVRPGSCLQLHVRGGAYGAIFSLRTLCKLRTTRNCSSDVERR